MLTLLYKLDSILRADEHFMMGVLEKEAMDADTTSERTNMILNIRNLLTLWGPGDYKI